MNWLDIVLLCLAGIGFMKGLFDGFIKQVVSLIALVIGLFFSAQAASFLKVHIAALGWFPEQGVTILSYIAGFLLVVGIILLAGEIINRVVSVTPLSIFNHLSGGLIGFCFMLIFLSLILNGLEAIDQGSVLLPRQAKVESILYTYIRDILPTISFHHLF